MQSQLTRRMTFRYILLVGAIAFLVGLSYLMQTWAIGTQESFGNVINTSGRQRMLAMEIKLEAEKLWNASTKEAQEKSRTKLRQAAAELARNHADLIGGNVASRLPGIRSDELRALYFDGNPTVSDLVEKLVFHARKLAEDFTDNKTLPTPHLNAIRAESADSLIVGLDGIVRWHEANNAREMAKLRSVSFMVIILLIAALALSVATVFLPLVRLIQKDVKTIKETHKRHQGIMNSALDAIITTDDQGRVVELNRAAKRMFGFEKEEPLGRNIADLLIPRDLREKHMQAFNHKRLCGGDDFQGMRKMTKGLRSDGTVFPIELTVTSYHVDGKSMFTAFLRDLTKSNRAEDLNLRLGRIVEESLNEVYMFDADSLHFIHVNHGARENLGYSMTELKDLTPVDLKPGFTHEEFEEFILPLRKGNSKQLSFETVHKRKDGSVYDVRVKLQLMSTEDPPIFAAIMEDITEYKKAEKALRDIRDELELRVIDRTKLLHDEVEERKRIEKDLILAKKRAEEANRAKSLFLSSMSHELRTPLNAVLGFSQLLQSHPGEFLSERQRDFTNQIIKGGEYLLELINKILDLAKIEAGKVEFAFESLDSNRLCGECADLEEAAAFKKGVEIIWESPGAEMPEVRADRIRLKQSVLNLLSNAVKYNVTGGTVRMRCREVAGAMVRIEVTDTGPGIAKEKQKDLFEPFSRLGKETTDIEGSGIGLVVTKQLVELMGGRIGFESEVGKGSTFWIEMPTTVHSGPKGKGGDGGRKVRPLQPVALVEDRMQGDLVGVTR